MQDSFTIYTLLLLLGCLLTGIFFSWILYRKTKHLDQRLRYALAAGRALVIAAIGALLFFPLIRRISYQLEKPLIVIGQDNSLSVGHIRPAGFNAKQYQQQMQELADELGKKYEVRVYHFSDSVKAGFDFSNRGKLTNGYQFINQLSDQLLNRNVGAVVLATDGLFNKGGSPLYETGKLKAPVYTIALGDTARKKDVLVAQVNHNSLVYLNNEFTIEVQVQAIESKGESPVLTVLENGKQVYQSKIAVNSNAFVRQVPVKLKAARIGLQKYTVQLGTVSNEISGQNNVQHIFIDVIDARQKMLLAAAAPHPDIAALKQAVSLNKNYAFKAVIGDDLDTVRINDYSLIVLYQLPGQGNEGNAFLRRVQQSQVSLWYILGAQSNLGAFNQMQQEVRYNGTNTTLQESFAYTNPDFSSFDLSSYSKSIASFDPLQSPIGKVSVAGSALVALNQQIGKIRTGAPLLFFMNGNGRKTGYLAGEGLWRWKLSEAQLDPGTPVFNQLISNVVQYLSVKDDKRKFKVYPARNTFDENENVILNAVLYNDSYEAVNTPDVNIELKNSEGKSYNFLFSRAGSAYQLDAGALPPGNYTYTASATLGGTRHNAQGLFYINALNAEYQQTTANHQLLHTLSAQTGGKMYQPADLLKIISDIEKNEQIKTLSYEDRKYEELINFKWLFVLIMALLATEWFFRKRNGEI